MMETLLEYVSTLSDEYPEINSSKELRSNPSKLARTTPRFADSWKRVSSRETGDCCPVANPLFGIDLSESLSAWVRSIDHTSSDCTEARSEFPYQPEISLALGAFDTCNQSW